ncbi:ATP-binding protein [Streptomyces sp. NPDC003077]|uniref:ATP-binding protein n=1 Tax=Streptomyces sp. NPDC003077 TaxID=3154443 RepID=UPI0033AFDCF4
MSALLAALVVTGGLCLWAALAAPAAVRGAVAWGGGAAAVVLSLALAVAVHGWRTVRHYRARLGAMEAEADALADETLPMLVDRLRDGASVDTALDRTPAPASPAHQRIVRTLAQEVGRGERMRAAAMSACANAAGRVQALAAGMLADLREMEHRHGEEVLGDLLRLDHSTAQAGRLADSIAVLTGARSGRRWHKPIPMESILRGAMGRISAYRRVRLHHAGTVAVAGHAAEGVMHALAEIMDNATSFSPPSSMVHVYVEEAQAGVVVTVEDSGLVMSETALRRAEQAVSARSLDLMSLSGTRLGLAVVGCLARKHGLTVSFRPSARGGTGVVVLIPRQLITQVQEKPAAPALAGEPATSALAGESAALQTPDEESLRSEITATDDSRPPLHPHDSLHVRQELAQRAERNDPANRTDPAERNDPANRTDPAERNDPAKSTDLAERNDPAKRADSARRHGPDNRTDPAKQADPDNRTGPAKRNDPSERSLPNERTTPAGQAAPAAQTAPAASAPPTSPRPSPPPIEYGPSGLPKRRRGQTLAAARGPAASDRAADPDRPRSRPRSGEDTAARFHVFRQAVRGRAAADDAPPPGDEDEAPTGTPATRPDGPDAPTGSPATPLTPTPRPEDDTR